jgi:hypothetical protein
MISCRVSKVLIRDLFVVTRPYILQVFYKTHLENMSLKDKTSTAGALVKKIQSYNTEEQAVSRYCKNGVTSSGFSEQWVRSVFRNRVILPVLDHSIDVHGEGVKVLDVMGISPDIQSEMWQRWAVTPEDVQASWLEDWKLLDTSDSEDVFSYVGLMVKIFTS